MTTILKKKEKVSCEPVAVSKKAGNEVEEATELANVSSLRTGKPRMKVRAVVPSVTSGMII